MKKFTISFDNPGAMYCRECWGKTKWLRWWTPDQTEPIHCPKCNGTKLRHINARRVKDGRRRKYECRTCGAKFLSTERFTGGKWMGGRRRKYRCTRCSKTYISEETVENVDQRFA